MASSNDSRCNARVAMAVAADHTPLHYVTQVIRKLDNGTYPVEATQCLCGVEPDDLVLTERDRYTIPHRMVMCNECCLIRANPRMTKEAYRAFYNNEYLPIYDGFEDKGKSNDQLFEQQVIKGREIREFIKQQEVSGEIKSVMDFGGGKGGSLVAFQEAGCSVLNVDWNDADRSYATAHGIPSIASLELAKCFTGSRKPLKDFKADLIILQDVVEHLLDLSYIKTIGQHLNENGRLFIYTPGVFNASPAKLFQNAHTYQFIADTLEYVMLSMGFLAEYLDEHIISLWNNSYYSEPYAVKPVQWKRYLLEHLQQTEKRSIPPVRTRSKFTQRLMLENLEANLPRQLPELSVLRGQFAGEAAIVGGGPSVDGQLEKIKSLRASGCKIFTIDRMYPWLMEQGIEPDFAVLLDSSEDVVEGLTSLGKDTEHLLVANGLPKVFDILAQHKVHIIAGGLTAFPEARDIWVKHGYKKVTIMATGGSVVLAAMYLALVLGFKKLHIFGLDCMVPSKDANYAKGVAGKGVERSYYEIEVGNEVVLTCNSFIAFAQQFFKMVDIARQWGMLESIDVYGESLINKMWEKPTEDEKWQTIQPAILGSSTQLQPQQ